MRELWANIFTGTFFLSLTFLLWGVIKPHGLPRFLQKLVPTRKRVVQVFGSATTALFLLIGFTAPPQQQATVSLQEASSTQKAATSLESKSAKKDTVETKTITETQPIAYTTTTKDDSTLSKGQSKVTQEGVDGVETRTYSVIYTNGKETSRVLISQVASTPPVQKIIANGTYVVPAPAPSVATSCGSGYYVNSVGVCVPSPSANPAGATARCVDGTYSYSLHRSGTCSHHGGVAAWL